MAAEQQDPDELGSAPSERRQRLWLGPAVTVLAVVAVVATASYVTSDRSAEQPPPLRLVQGSAAEAALTAADSAGPSYVLDGSLPAGTPDPAPVYEFVPGTADESTVSRLAEALGLTAEPVRQDGGWLVTDPAGQLNVSDDGGWSWLFMSPTSAGVDCPPELAADAAESFEGRLTVCAYAAGAPTETTGPDGTVMYRGSDSHAPVSDGPPPAEDVVRHAATPVFEATGVDATAMQLTSMSGMTHAVVRQRVAGLPAFGLETGVTVLPDGTVMNGYGFLGSSQPGDSYPLIPATEAFDQLVAQSVPPIILDQAPQTGAELATPAPTRVPGVSPPAETLVNPSIEPSVAPVPVDVPLPPPPEPLRVTGAELGLMLNWADDRQLLVPAWLFTVEGDSNWVIPVVAVDPEFLAEPEPSPDPGAGGGEPGAPGTTEPLPEPAPYPTISFTDATLAPDGVTLTVTVSGPAQGEGPCEATYAIDAKAGADQVVLAASMIPNNQGAEVACILIAEIVPLTVTLNEPLGDRLVIDAATGLEVPVQGR